MVYPAAVSEYFRTEFEWNERRNEAATLLAMGKTQLEVAETVNVTPKTIYNWLQDMEFAAEVDRLSLMVGIASRAQRLRWLNQTIAKKLNPDGSLQTDKDVLDLIKIAISETDGAKIDISKLAELFTGEAETPSQPQLSSSSDAIDVTPEIQASDSDLAPQPVVPTGDDEHNQ